MAMVVSIAGKLGGKLAGQAGAYRPLAACAASLVATGAAASLGPWRANAEAAQPPPPPVITPKAAAAERTRSQALRRLFTLAKRLLEVMVRMLPVGLSHLVRSWFGEGKLRGETKPRFLQRLVRALASLGPVGIKWGQWASTRYDLFDDDTCEALGSLTNHAPSHSYEVTEALVEASFDGKVGDIFETFEREPVASGSIGQVHIATLRTTRRKRGEGPPALNLKVGFPDRGGLVKGLRKVAVKVQHPALAERLDVDLALLNAAGSLLGPRVQQTVHQFASNFEAQLDFRDEAANLRKFSDHFQGAFWSSLVSFPVPVEGLVTREVLVESFEEGESVAKFLTRNGNATQTATSITKEGTRAPVVAAAAAAAAADAAKRQLEGSGRGGGTTSADDMVLRTAVAATGMQCLLKMLVFDNFVHADLHPGNVIIRMEEQAPLARLQRWVMLGDGASMAPHIVLLDAGLAVAIDAKIKESVQEFFKSIVEKDSVRLATAILGLDLTGQPFVKDKAAFVEECRQLWDKQYSEHESGAGRAGDNLREFFGCVRAHHVNLDPAAMVSAMSMIVLEGWQHRLAPDVGVLDSIDSALGKGGTVFGLANSLSESWKSARAKAEALFER